MPIFFTRKPVEDGHVSFAYDSFKPHIEIPLSIDRVARELKPCRAGRHDPSVRPVHARINSAGLIRFLSPNYYILPDENFAGARGPLRLPFCGSPSAARPFIS